MIFRSRKMCEPLVPTYVRLKAVVAVSCCWMPKFHALALSGRNCCDIHDALELGCGVTGAEVDNGTNAGKP